MDFMTNYVYFFNIFISIYLLVYIAYVFISSIFGALYAARKRRKTMMHSYVSNDFFYPISIIVPAYNEGETVIQTINNLLKLDYKKFEIVIVNDGSTDNTLEILLRSFPLKRETNRPVHYQVVCHPITEIYSCQLGKITLTVVCKENGACKSDATNAGINVSRYPYFVNMDADEILQRDALVKACPSLLQNDNVIAIGGNIKISNDTAFINAEPVDGGLGSNPVVNMQIIEYSRSFQGARVFQNMLNANLIISGGYGIFKKDMVVAVGGYDPASKGEDMEITVKLHHYCRKNKIDYVMDFVPESICWTQGASTLKDLKNQRTRWQCGLLQTLWKYKTMNLNPKYGILGLFMIPYMILYELLAPIIALIGLSAIVMGFIIDPQGIAAAIGTYGIYLVFGIILTFISYLENRYVKIKPLSFGEVMKVLGTSILDSLFFRPFIAVINFIALFKYKKVTKSKWVSPKRVHVKDD